jgi:hypothetical protein
LLSCDLLLHCHLLQLVDAKKYRTGFSQKTDVCYRQQVNINKLVSRIET